MSHFDIFSFFDTDRDIVDHLIEKKRAAISEAQYADAHVAGARPAKFRWKGVPSRAGYGTYYRSGTVYNTQFKTSSDRLSFSSGLMAVDLKGVLENGENLSDVIRRR